MLGFFVIKGKWGRIMEMSGADIIRCEKIISKITSSVLSKVLCKGYDEYNYINTFPWRNFRAHVETVLLKVFNTNCNKLITASKVKPQVYKMLSNFEQKNREATKKLQQINLEIKAKKEELEKLVLTNRNLLLQNTVPKLIDDFKMPPQPEIVPTREGTCLPNKPGIYFLYSDLLECVYVGKSVNLCNRLRLGNHQILKENHLISFVEIPICNLDYAEIFYMTCLRPSLNFNGKLIKTKENL